MNSSSSPRPSFQESESATLERLISYFVAAKRSLSATAHVYRAHEIVDAARSLVEEAAVLGARNAFLERGVNEEASALGAVRDGLDSIGRDAGEGFKAIITLLDEADVRLQGSIHRLQDTVVDPSFSSGQPVIRLDDSVSPQSSAQNASKTLHDFISESGHKTLHDSIHQDIDAYQNALGVYQKSQGSFDQSLVALGKALQKVENASPRSPRYQNSLSQGDDRPNPQHIPDLFHGLTSHATETASLLQSLIEHYDLCSTALKHTEGGGEAARAAAEPTTDQATEAMDQSLYEGNKAREPITDEEKSEMISVIENDAQEVDDVVFEIRERISEMESHLSQLSTHATSARTCHAYLAKVLSLLHGIGRELPTYIAAAKTFNFTWASLEEDLKSKMTELAALTDIYEGFLASYASVLDEAGRRNAVEAKMRKVLEKAKREIDAMCDDELETRRHFLGEVSEFLPRDLWPGLEDAPARWDFVAVPQGSLRQQQADQSGHGME